MESHIKQSTGGAGVRLSQQQCVSCSGGKGCGGGVQTAVYRYIKSGNPVVALDDYPYVAKADPCLETLDELEPRGAISDYKFAYAPEEGVPASKIIALLRE